MMELDQALIQLNIDKDTLDAIASDESAKNELIAVLMHCLYKVPDAKDAAAVLLQYIAEVRTDGGPGSGNFGHSGVPGQVGGSAPSEGSNNSTPKKKGKYAGLSTEGRKVVEDNIKNPNHFGESDDQKEANRKKLISALKEKGVETKYVEEKRFEGLGYGSYVAIDTGMTYDENIRLNQALNQTTYSFGFDRSDYIKACKDSGVEPRLSSEPETPYDGVFYSKSGKYQKDDTPVYSYSDASTQLSDEEIVRFSGHDEELNPDGAAKAASAAEKAIASMSEEERGALKNYTSQYGNGSYNEVNGYLTSGAGSDEAKKAAELVTSALDHAIGADCICSRGAGSVHGTKDDKAAAKIIGQIEKGNFSNAGKLKDMLVGQIIKNDAAMSTSPGGSTSGYGQRPVQMTFKTPSEAKAVNITSLSNYGGGASEAAKALASTGMFGSIAYESEVLFKPGTRYRIDDVQFSISVDGKNKKSGKIHIVASILTDHADGGPGSGNWGHEGVPGEVGGSAPSNSGSGSIPKKLDRPKRPKKSDYANDEDYQKAREEFRAKRDEYDAEIQKRVRAASDRTRKYDTHEKAKKRFSEIGIDMSEANTSKIDPKIYDDISDAYQEMFDRFPEVKANQDKYKQFGLYTYEDKGVCDFLFSAKAGLELGDCWADYDAAIEEDLDLRMTDYTTYGDGTIMTSLRHEFGHHVDYYVRSQFHMEDFDHSKESLEEYKKRRVAQSNRKDEFFKELRKLTKNHCKTEYAFTNENEAFAEGFAEYTSNPNSEYGKAFGEFLLRWYPK